MAAWMCNHLNLKSVVTDLAFGPDTVAQICTPDLAATCDTLGIGVDPEVMSQRVCDPFLTAAQIGSVAGHQVTKGGRVERRLRHPVPIYLGGKRRSSTSSRDSDRSRADCPGRGTGSSVAGLGGSAYRLHLLRRLAGRDRGTAAKKISCYAVG